MTNTNSIYILVQKNHAKPLWSKGAKNTIGLFYICKWYNMVQCSQHFILIKAIKNLQENETICRKAGSYFGYE